LKNPFLILGSNQQQEINMSEPRYSQLFGLNELSRIFDDRHPTSSFDWITHPQKWVPQIDIRDDESGFIIFADIPGLDSDDVEITLDQNTLSINGQRSLESESDEGAY